jgi:septal ring factor EnvC (AmiA/AmiB activator)
MAMRVPAPLRSPRLLALLLAALLAWTVAAPASGESLDQSREHLVEIQRRIEQTTRSLHQKALRESALAADLKTIEGDLDRIRRHIALRSRRSDLLKRKIAEKQEEINRTRSSMAARKEKVRRRLIALYKEGPAGLFGVLFSSASPVRMAEDYDYMGRIVRRDKMLLSTYRQQLTILQGQTEELGALREKQNAVLRDLTRDRRTQRRALVLKKKLLAAVHRDRAALASRVTRLRRRARALQALIKKLELGGSQGYTAKTPFASEKGHLPWPVKGSIKVGFGTWRHPKLGTLYDSQGIEIAVSGQQPIRAVWTGRVVFADRFKGYGNLIILDHGDGFYSLYAQASRLVRKVGDRVKQGETLAFSGFPGAGGVYFEIRHGGTPLDPTAWLAAR